MFKFNIALRDLESRTKLIGLGDRPRDKLTIGKIIAELYAETLLSKITGKKGSVFERRTGTIYHPQKEYFLKIRGMNLHLRPNNLLILVKELFAGEEYAIPSLEPGAKILDIGANIGLFSIMAARKNPNAKIYAYEPAKENFDLMVKNIESNKITNVIPINKGISSEDGTAKLYLHESLTNSMNNPSKDYEEITLERFDSVVEKIRPDLIKMDIEGHEYDCLSGQKNIGFPQWFLIELHECMGQEKINAVLEKFKEFKIISQSKLTYTFKKK